MVIWICFRKLWKRINERVIVYTTFKEEALYFKRESITVES